MIDVLIYALILLIGVKLGQRLRDRQISSFLEKIAEEKPKEETITSFLEKVDGKPPTEEPQIEEIEILLERHGDMFYMYRASDQQFMGQGKNEIELLTRLIYNFPDNHKNPVWISTKDIQRRLHALNKKVKIPSSKK